MNKDLPLFSEMICMKYDNFSDFWHYNKMKIFAAIIAVFLVVLAFNQCSFGSTLDLGIVHISPVMDADGDEFLKSLKENVTLKKSGDELSLEFTPIYMPDSFKAGAELGSIEKAQVEISAGKSTLFIIDEETLYSYQNDDIFYDLSGYAKEYGINQDECYYDSSGKVMGISVNKNAYLESVGLECANLYVGVRNHLESKKDEYENAFKVLEYILKNR